MACRNGNVLRDLHCFYIVESGTTGAVVGIHDPYWLAIFRGFTRQVNQAFDEELYIGSHLMVSQWNGSDKQLWKWTSDGSLENKQYNLVISINETGAVVVQKKQDSLHQKWRLQNGMLRSQEKEDSALTLDTSSSLLTCTTANDSSFKQKWKLIPQATWKAYQEYLSDPNPLVNALIVKANLLEHLKCILGCTVEEYEAVLAECFSTTNDCATRLDEAIKDVGKAKVAGGSAAIGGGVMSLIGLALAPFTAGASLTLTVAGGVTAGAGGLTSLGATITETCYNKAEQSKVKAVIEKAIRFSTALQSMVLEVCKEMERAFEFSKTPKGMSFRQMLQNERKLGKSIYKATEKVKKVGETVKKGVDNFKAFKEIKSVAAFIEADAQAIKGATVGLAENAAAGGLKVPFTGRVLLQAGSVGAKVFSSALSVLGIAFGIWDVVAGAKQMEQGSAAAKQFKKSAQDINKEGQALIKTYYELSSNK